MDEEKVNYICSINNTLHVRKPPVEKFTFHGEDTWIIKINDAGIFFNREKFPDDLPDDFARKFIDILEKNFNVKFIEKEK